MRIAIAGFGAEGKSNYKYWNTPEHEVVIFDERAIPADELPTGAQAVTGEGVFERLNGFDMVVRTAGLAPRKVSTDGKVWSATNEFFANCPAPIIGVTGTKGKGTTCSLIAEILRASGKTVHLVGNIGVPALGALGSIKTDDIVVYELSSFQLWDLEISPHVAVVLGVEPDHLDIHADYTEYVAAKARIVENQLTTDRVVYSVNGEVSEVIARKSVGQRLSYPSDRTAHVRGNFFYYGNVELCELDHLQLPGRHNIDNACAAITAAWPWVQEPVAIAEGLRSFDGLPHRLKFVAEVAGVRYYDDSIATTPGSAMAAIQAFSGPKIIVLGGSDKGAEYGGIIELCKATGTRVVAIGQTGTVIQQMCSQFNVPCDRVEGGMEDVVARVSDAAKAGDTVILSPASASFDQYRDYIDRGEQFIAAIHKLAGSNV